MKFDKLVRDNELQELRKNGIAFKAHIEKDDAKFWAYLKEKLFKDVNDFLASEDEIEVAEILDTVEAIMIFMGPDKARSVAKWRKKLAEEEGLFTKRLILDEA